MAPTRGDPVLQVQVMSLSPKHAGPNTSAIGTILVVDGDGTVVAGATVSVSWGGEVSGTSTGITDVAGQVVLESPKTRASSGIITLEVTGASKTGYSYTLPDPPPTDSIDL